MMKKKTLKKNSSNRKPISYSTEFRLDINLNNFVRKPIYDRCVSRNILLYLAFINGIIHWEEIMEA
jgi:hypothetical protein